MKIYHVPGTRSMRVIWLCEELGLEYETELVDFSPDYRASSEWRRLNPVGKVPVLTDGSLTMFESGAMVDYLLARYGQGRLQPPVSDPEFALALQWSWFAEATFARPLGEIVNHRRVFPDHAQNPAAIREMMDRSVLCLQAVDAALTGREYLLNFGFSAADVMMGYTLLLADKLLDEPFPAQVRDYYERLVRRAGFQIADAGNNLL